MNLIIFLVFIATSKGSSLYSDNANVIELDPDNFESLVKSSDQIWFVEFYAPWCAHCKKFAVEYNKFAYSVKGIVKVGAVNADEHKELSQEYAVKGFPTIKIFGSNKNKPKLYDGPRTAEDMIGVLLSLLKNIVHNRLGKKDKIGKDVVVLNDANFDETVLQSDEQWMVEFFAPWCGHCQKLKPEWAKAAKELKGKVNLGAIDATANTITVAEYDVGAFPTIKFFPGGSKSKEDAENYEGGRNSDEIISWALDKYDSALPAPEIVEIVDEEILMKTCKEAQLCIVSFLPHIRECQSKCRYGYLDLLKEMAEKFKVNKWGWLWTAAGAQPKIEEILEIGDFAYPTMAAVNPKRMKFKLFRGSFSKAGIEEFLRGLLYGKKGDSFVIRATEMPEIKQVLPWDGKDVPIEEDDKPVGPKYEL